MRGWNMFLTAALLSAVLASTGCTPYQAQGGAAGGAIGGLAGALLDHRNPWRGGVIGAALGGLAGATISEVSVRGARQAANTGQPVEYSTENGRGVYRADPLPANVHTNCKKVREKVYEDGRLVKDRVREVCEGEKSEDTY